MLPLKIEGCKTGEHGLESRFLALAAPALLVIMLVLLLLLLLLMLLHCYY